MSFGQMPLANGFRAPGEAGDEYRFPLRLGICHQCSMVQLEAQPPADKMFGPDYPYFSSTSFRMAAHFEAFAHEVISKYLRREDGFVVEIGSNDGIMQRYFAAAGVRILGIDPSASVVQRAFDCGLDTLVRFFDAATASEILAERGPADAIVAANVMCHVQDMHAVLDGICILLAPGGALVFEDPYLGDIVHKTAYDQIYDEHAFYFSIRSLDAILGQYGLEIFNVSAQTVHGGSMRYFVGRRGTRTIDGSVAEQRLGEHRMKLDCRETFEDFRRNVERSRDRLLEVLKTAKVRGHRVVGYGATSKSTTVINYCGIDSGTVEFIADNTPAKQGKLTPGMRIPIRSQDEFRAHYPDHALLFAWNHADEIFAKEREFCRKGGSWIVYVPEVAMLRA